MTLMKTYILLTLLGLIFFGLELFVPGGVLGAVGGLLLLAAVIIGFSDDVLGRDGGVVGAILMLVGLCVYVVLILRMFPSTPIGRLLTLSNDMKTSKASDDSEDDLVGVAGTAHTDLRPAGIALLNGRRVDVVAEGNWISRGAPVRVVEVKGSRVVVREVAH
jgi:membrane-bound serine protease (ClpP class)